MDSKASENLARNLRHLRTARGLTQQQLAELSGVPRPTWANLESGASNPTLSVLVRVATALSVSLEELIGPPRATGRFYRADELSSQRRGAVHIRQLLPDQVAGLSLERMELPAGSRMKGTPHTPGTREYLTCESGVVELLASGEVFRLSPGDVVVFRGDQPHSYRNPGSKGAVAYSVVALTPIA